MTDNRINCQDRLMSHGIRLTPNRELVFHAIAASSGPISLYDIEMKLMTVDKSSISRILNLFRDKGLVHAIEDGSGSVKYELCESRYEHDISDMHPHFYCARCHKTVCLE